MVYSPKHKLCPFFKPHLYTPAPMSSLVLWTLIEAYSWSRLNSFSIVTKLHTAQPGLNKGRDFTPFNSAQVSSWAYPALFLLGTWYKETKV